MKRLVLRSTAVMLTVLIAVSICTISVSHAVSFTNSKGWVKVVCGKYSKKFKAKKYGKNFCKALNAALDTARKKAKDNKKATVTVSKGNYSLDRTIKIYSNTTLKAKGCYFKYYGNLLRNGYNGKASAVNGYNGARNITIDGGSWDAAVPYSQAGTSNWRIQHSTLRFAHAKNITIKNCKFRNNYNCHDIELGGVDSAKITKCDFSNDKGVNIFKNDGGREAIQLDVNTSEAMPEFRYFDNTPCKNITLSYSTFENKYRAIGSHHAVLGNTFDNIKVHHNTFKNIGGITVYGVYWTNSKIYSNKMEDVGLGVDIRNMTTGSGYNFYNNNNLTCEQAEDVVKDSKIYIYDNDISLREEDNTYVRACGIRVMGEKYSANDKKTGIKEGIYNVYGVNVGVNASGTAKPNTIKNNVAVGIQMNNTVDSLVKNNVVNAENSVSESSNGIEVKGAKNTEVSLNTVNNGLVTNGRGIYLTTTAAGVPNDSVTVSANTINNFKMSGIYAYKSSNSVIEHNKIDSTQDMGISVRTCENTSVTNNTVNKCVNAGVYVYSNSNNSTIEDNTITSTKKTGVKLQKAKSTKVQKNSISDSGEYGALVRESDKTELIENNIDKTASYGVRINYGSDNTELYNNSIVSPNNECIYYNGANDLSKDKEKTLTVAENYLDTDVKTAAVSVTNANVAARIYSNYRTDGKDIFYRFKGAEDSKYTKVYDKLQIDKLSIEKCEGYNILNWNSSADGVAYRVYREDETGTRLISDTPEKFCFDNDIYKKTELETIATEQPDETVTESVLEASSGDVKKTTSEGVSESTTEPQTDASSDTNKTDKTVMEKLNIMSYSVSAYRAFSEVKFFGEPVSVDFED